jgi:chorismate lyase/3-hydroxybenzoate synthase
VDESLVRDAAGLRESTVRAYGLIGKILSGSSTPYAVRLWNHISDITKAADGDCNRYMAFNAGRFQAVSDWYGGPERFDASLPTASGVGYDGQGLIVHCLAARHPGRAVANPRQVQPHRYSVRYGPRPPCFSRATILSEDVAAPMVLIGGTASIRGEESMYDQDLMAQFQETLANLSSLLTAAGAGPGDEALATLHDLRVYYRDAADKAAVTEMVRSNFASVDRPQIVRAGLCRAELLVEIEGVAHLAGARRVPA